MASEGILLGMGNPLLDISAVADTDFLQKYDLKANDAILAEEKHNPLFDDIVEKYSVEYIAGGATQNSMRVAQWIIGKKNATTYFGCVGKDKNSKTLEEKAKEAGVQVHYQNHDTQPTGICAVIITGHVRSLVTKLDAANYFTKEHLAKPENKALLGKAQYYYISGFFLTVSPESILEVAHHACSENKTFMMNLSAPFLSQFFKEPMMQAFPYIDILFGNETEALTFSQEQNLGTEDIKEIALKIAELPKENKKKGRIVVITQGEDPVVMAKDGKVTEHPAFQLPPEQLVDTNGAGDAFVGGFLSQLVQKKSLETCIKCGIWAATEVIKRSGCTFPEKVTFRE